MTMAMTGIVIQGDCLVAWPSPCRASTRILQFLGFSSEFPMFPSSLVLSLPREASLMRWVL